LMELKFWTSECLMLSSYFVMEMMEIWRPCENLGSTQRGT
jgi:hypothetical protein